MSRSERLAMGELEAAVMNLLWEHGEWRTPGDEHGEWQTPGDVHGALEPTHPVAYTTVMTILVRLWQKGRLERHKTGRAFSYRPKLTRDEDAARRMGEVLDSLGDHAGALNRFVETLDAGDRAQLRRLLGSATRRSR